MSPLSVVVPAYDEEHRIGGSIDRVLSWSAERGVPLEIIVVDDGSRDGTARLVESYAPRGVRLVRLSPTGNAALRAGGASTGERVLISTPTSTPIASSTA
jgi:glycosyltransferase involved in cell wall biosynthesis